MLRKTIAYILMLVGFIGTGFFKNYIGTLIPFTDLWFILSIIVGVLGFVLLYLSKESKAATQENFNRDRLERIKQTGERILLTVDNCEIRENNYYEEVISNGSSRIEQIDALYDPNRNYKQNYIEQSAIIYYYKLGNEKHRMTSHSFPFNAKILAQYIENKKLVLYVNRFDRNEYAFSITGL